MLSDVYEDLADAFRNVLDYALTNLEAATVVPVIQLGPDYSTHWKQRKANGDIWDLNWKERWLPSGDFLRQLMGSDEMKSLLSVLDKHPNFKQYFSEPHGRRNSRSVIQMEMLIVSYFLEPMILQQRSFVFNFSIFQRQLEGLIEYFNSQTISAKVFTPFFGLQSALDEIHLSDDTVLRRLNDVELSFANQFGEYNGRLGTLPHMLFIPHDDQWIIVTTYSEDKEFGTQISSQSTILNFVEKNRTQGELLSIVLRLLKIGQPRLGRTFDIVEGFNGAVGGSVKGTSPGPMVSPNRGGQIDEANQQAVKDLFGKLESQDVLNSSRFGIPVRRWLDHDSRQRWEDGILDLVIAAESLFIKGVTSELNFKIALFAAIYIKSERYRPSQVREVFSRAYESRSRLVHGEPPKANQPSISTLISDLSELIGVALRQAVEDNVLPREANIVGCLDQWLDAANP